MILKLSIPLVCMWFGSIHAAPYVPNDEAVLLKLDGQKVVAFEQAQSVSSSAAAKTLARELIRQASKPGYSDQYQLAASILAHQVEHTRDPEIRYLWAQVLQHQHHFNEASEQLSLIFKEHPNHAPARLMAARLALIQQNHEVAEWHCKQLLGQVDVETVEVCLLEAKSHAGQLQESYHRLKAVFTTHDELPDSHRLWMTLMVTDMALKLNDLSAAADHLQTYPAFNNISYLVTWSDVSLALNQHQQVMTKLSALTDEVAVLENSLVLRLALAEQQRNEAEGSAHNHWLTVFEQRMAQLNERGENLHPNDLSRYHLTLKPDASKALHWAKINWQQSKEYQDEWLLTQARAMNQEPIK